MINSPSECWSASMMKSFNQDIFFLKMHVLHKNSSHVAEGTFFCTP